MIVEGSENKKQQDIQSIFLRKYLLDLTAMKSLCEQKPFFGLVTTRSKKATETNS
jgi:hypothetical protein